MLSRRLLSLVLMVGLLFATTGGALAQDGGPVDPQVGEAIGFLVGTGFTYQGELKNGGSPVNGMCDFQFTLFSDSIGGIQLGTPQTVTGVTVANGRFTVILNSAGQFGPLAFDGSGRWLATSVRCPAGSGGYTSLSPRQFITAAPLALALPGMRTEQNTSSPMVIGGHVNNSVADDAYGATISGGGSAGQPNTVNDQYGTIGGGYGNTTTGQSTTIAGGESNTTGDLWDTVGGGYSNSASGGGATIAGGNDNTASGDSATIAGGYTNLASGTGATIAGGWKNIASGEAAFIGGGGWDGTTIGGNRAAGIASVIGGGYKNVVTTTATFGTISGGHNNTASNTDATVGGGGFNNATGFAATVAGGYGNIASGDFSFAGGADARAIHLGSFVWANQNTIPISSTAVGQFLVRATGGISLTTNNGGTTGCNLSAGGGTWNCTSDRNAKANFAAVDNVAVLNALMSIPIQTWNFNTQDAGIQHMGPMAQDFYAAYGLGEGELTISTVDADGVALAAIQGLYTVVQQKDAEIAALEARVAALESASAPASVTVQQPAPAQNTLQLLMVLVVGLAVGGGLTLGAFMLGKRQTVKA